MEDMKLAKVVDERRYWQRVWKDNAFYAYVSWMNLVANGIICYKFKIPLSQSWIMYALAIYWVYRQNKATSFVFDKLKSIKLKEKQIMNESK